MKNPEPWLFLALALAQAAHSIEEQLAGFHRLFPVTTGELHQRLAFIPVLDPGADGFAAANMAIIALLLTLAFFVVQGQAWARRTAIVAAAIELLNSSGHLGAALFLGRYFPGSLTAIGLVVFSGLFLFSRPTRRRA